MAESEKPKATCGGGANPSAEEPKSVDKEAEQ